MKTIYRIFAQGCMISTAITVCFSIFIKVSNERSEPAITLSRYFLILGFSFIISLANLLLTLRGLPKIARILIHYAVLLVSFFVIFILASKTQNPSGAQIFICFFLFTCFYALVFGIVAIVKKLVPKLSKKRSAAGDATSSKETYTSLYR